MRSIQDPQTRRVSEVVGVVVLLAVALVSVRFFFLFNSDFRAFYCSGAAVAIGANPYLVEPLRACEQTGAMQSAPLRSGAVLPSPLPGYDLAVFALLSGLPYRTAGIVWQVVLWVCVLVAIVALWRLTRAPLVVVITAFLFSDGYVSSLVGNMVPIAVAGVALAAWCASRRRYELAALSSLLTLCEPHIGLGVWLAALIYLRRARWIVVLGACGLGALTYAVTGTRWTLAYLREVVPGQISAEVANNDGQYSLTNLLHLAGVADQPAILAGSLSYVVALIAGIVIAGRLRASTHEDAFLIVLPPAFALIGGPFIHLIQMAAAMPAALLLFAKLPAARRPLAWAITMLAIPWTALVGVSLFLAPVFALGIAQLAWTFIRDRRIAAAVTVGQLVLMLVAMKGFVADDVSLAHIVLAPTAFAEDGWRLVVALRYSGHAAFFLPLKLPTWGALLLVAGASERGASSA